MLKTVIFLTTGLLITVFLLYFVFAKHSIPEGKEIHIIDTWELPDALEEVSGIAYIGNNLMACIQDEDGIIFIYDMDKRQIERKIEFAGAGDYESITLAGNIAYVLRSDGTIYEVSDFLSNNPKIRTLYEYEVSGKNFEGLAYDEKSKRLLLSIKERSGKEYRPLYSFDLHTERLEEVPVFRIAFSDPIFS